ncbi:glycerol-3-phosphate dehydrogenase (NAD+) [Marchantia polymorpha subsp. ruderalis]|uniref:Glycerol-3-phosphate dehydrogenase [NAD(+)] n=2 Tax=Marchantia polymorpha TaxID=3197 RepID=A0A176VRQ6_MARPO|nr:hypothetical protein AXG93_1877s1070 [Marchantia polymorpha subsp. ruderalis]PTQ34860.1 hypothetical protein MARPO_0076s0092 [Marchantia polymorpha]BBN16518.1 hypothetical protein Mp_7g07020 [Marchantia polymorpha subsp. ruderalis]|eukprot:PTQ34860.1 hypothetical protein MARPO_0076s0092 [Marchantia polymorpha]
MSCSYAVLMATANIVFLTPGPHAAAFVTSPTAASPTHSPRLSFAWRSCAASSSSASFSSPGGSCCCINSGVGSSGRAQDWDCEAARGLARRSSRVGSFRRAGEASVVRDLVSGASGENLDSQAWSRANVGSLSRRSRPRSGRIMCMAATDEAVKAKENAQQKRDSAEEVAVSQLLGQKLAREEEILRVVNDDEEVVNSAGTSGSSNGPLAMAESSDNVETGSIGVSISPSTILFQRSKEESQIVRTAWEKLVRWSKSWQLLQARRQANALQSTKKVVILGGGSFGTAMAVLLARNKAEMEVTLLLRDEAVCHSINEEHVNSKYFPRHQLPSNVRATTDPKAALEGAQYCIHAVPVQNSASFLRSISEFVPPTLPIVSVSKGLELSTMEMMSQVIPRALGNPRQPLCVLSGPSFSIELMDELPTALVAASKDKDLARAAQQLLASRYLRVNTSSDVVGVEMAGALKNVLAIAAGIVEGMQLGNNCMAALVAQGCAEIRWLAEKMGAKSATLAGLSGTGDIMLTCFVKLSRNRSVGVRLGAGEKLEDILASMNQVAEGVATAGAVIALARKYRVQMPVLTAVARILENELTPKKAVLALMSLPQVEEV